MKCLVTFGLSQVIFKVLFDLIKTVAEKHTPLIIKKDLILYIQGKVTLLFFCVGERC
ncbi:hypothetical protein D3C75_1310930 [compost metagenome]